MKTKISIFMASPYGSGYPLYFESHSHAPLHARYYPSRIDLDDVRGIGKKIVSLSVVVLSIVLFSVKCIAQQEQMYTQYMFNKMSLNPGFAGNEKYSSLTGVIREQWNGFPGAPEAQVLSFNMGRIGSRVGFGLNFRRQSIGISKSIGLGGIYAYKFLLGSGTLSMGLEFSVKNLSVDFTDPRLLATQGLNDDPAIPNARFNKTPINVGTGIYYNTNRFYIGASVPRIINSDLDFDNNNYVSEEVRHLFLMGGVAFQINRNLSLTTQSLVKLAEHSPFDLDLSVSATFNEKYTGGLSFRAGGGRGDIAESIDLLFAFQISDQIMLGFSQDFTLSALRAYDNGSLEMVLHYAIGKKKDRVIVVNPRYF
jgi:type IX secretion system PorP/SprF family membrane protein